MKKLSEIGVKITPELDKSALNSVEKEIEVIFDDLAKEIKKSGSSIAKSLDAMFGDVISSLNEIDFADRMEEALIKVKKLRSEYNALKGTMSSADKQKYQKEYRNLISSPELKSFSFPLKGIDALSLKQIDSASNDINGYYKPIALENYNLAILHKRVAEETTAEIKKQAETEKQITKNIAPRVVSAKKHLDTKKEINKEVKKEISDSDLLKGMQERQNTLALRKIELLKEQKGYALQLYNIEDKNSEHAKYLQEKVFETKNKIKEIGKEERENKKDIELIEKSIRNDESSILENKRKQLEVSENITNTYKHDKILLTESLDELKSINKSKLNASREYISAKEEEKRITKDTSAEERIRIKERVASAKSSLDNLEKQEIVHKKLVKTLGEQVNSHRKINHQIVESFKNATTMQKIFDRIAFVLTAKMAYKAFDFISGSLMEGWQNAVKLESHLTRIAQISKGQSQQFISDSIKNSMKLGINIDDAVKSAYDSVSAQFSTLETQRLMEVSSKMAVVGFTEQAEAMDALTSILNSYQMSASEASKVSDILFKTIELGKTTLKEIAPDIGKLSATANLLGISFEEVSAGIATMTLNGIKTNVAMTAMNQLFLNLTKPTREAKEIFDKYNISLDISQIRTKGLAGTVAELNKLTDEEIATIASSNRGFRALATAINSGAEWTENYNKILNSTNFTQIAFNEQMETADMQLKKTKGEFVMLGVSIWEDVLPVIKLIGDAVLVLMKGFQGLYGQLILGTAALTVFVKSMSALWVLGKANLAITAIVGSMTILAGILGKIRKSSEETSRFEKEASEAQLSRIEDELSRMRRKQSLLLTLKDLQEKEAKGAELSKNEKALLVSVERELSKEYDVSKDNLRNYNKVLSDNTLLIEENEKAKTKAWKKANIENFSKATRSLENSGMSMDKLSVNVENFRSWFIDKKNTKYFKALEKGSTLDIQMKNIADMINEKNQPVSFQTPEERNKNILMNLEGLRTDYKNYEDSLQNLIVESTNGKDRESLEKALKAFRTYMTENKKANVDFLIKWYSIDASEKKL